MSYELTIEPLDITMPVEDGQTILDAALRQGIYLPHACVHGLCGSCKVQITDGEVDHGAASPFALMDIEREEGKALACCAKILSDVVIEADIEEEPDAENIPVGDYLCTVTRIEDLTPTIKSIYLKLDKKFHFQAGQYVQVTIPVLTEEKGNSRAFSIANTPKSVAETGEIELNVRIVPGGVGTDYLHHQLKVGDKLKISGPYGRFFVRKSNNVPLLFIAGGSGLSSPRSMILDLLEKDGWSQPITLVYGQRNQAELYYDQEFRKLTEQYKNFSYVPSLSDAVNEKNWQGNVGFVHEAAKEHFDNNFAGHQAYLCGPPVMIDACITTLMQGRLFERDIFTEKFLSAADAANSVHSPLFRKI